MSNYTCEYARSLLERAIEGGYEYLDAIAGVDACSAMNRCYEHMEILKCNTKPHFFVTHTDVPYKIEEYTIDQFETQMRLRLLDVMHEKFGTDTSDEALIKAVQEHNEMCRIMTEIGEFRKMDNPPLLLLSDEAHHSASPRDTGGNQDPRAGSEMSVPRAGRRRGF